MQPEMERDISGTQWVDVFASPTVEALLAELEPDDREAFETVAAVLTEERAWSASLEWLGLPWRWALVFKADASQDPALAYLVPDPRGSRVCIPVYAVGDGAPDITKLTKPVRAVVDQSAIIAGYLWADWKCTDFDPVAAEPLLASRA